MKKVEMLFYKTEPSKENKGMKYVLFEIVTDESQVIHDWGFSEWDGEKWGDIEMPEKYSATVVRWANTVDPQILLKEDSKIIRL
jgi:hypothetical protein